ncbi:fungal-specific transcription factor domain-containing protein [Ilyonectria sp. MPI-CAGE-AT-0026]|nr:fungal-specific transcription factor domain-containing protein [Ilyonectria sp. MPI-CAGE-AT-0026]
MNAKPPSSIQSKRYRPKVPLAERKRVVQACTTCRIRKRKCRPVPNDVCQQCKRNGSQCVFEPMQVDGLEDNNIARMSESKTSSFNNVIERFKEVYPDVELKLHHIEFLSELLEHSHNGCEDIAFADTEEMASLSMSQPLPFSRPCSPSIGLSDRNDMFASEVFFSSATQAVAQRRPPDLPQDYMQCIIPYRLEDIYGENWDQLLSKVLSLLPPRPEVDILLETFFRYGEANYYYMEEAPFRTQITKVFDDGPGSTSVDYKFIGLAFTVFALASQFKHLQEGSKVFSLSSDQDESLPGLPYFRGFQLLLPWMLANISLESVQSCLLIGLYILPTHSTEVAYAYLGLATRIAVCLKLHQNGAESNLPARLIEVRNRVFWTTYIVERRAADYFGYPEMIQQSDVRCSLPQRRVDLDKPESLQVDRLAAYTNLMLFADHAARSRLFRQETEPINFEKACSNLLSWNSNLPYALRALDEPHLRANVHLQLHYHMSWIYLGRADLIKGVRKRLEAARKTSPGEQSEDQDRNSSIGLLASCVNSAYEAIDIIELLWTRQKLAMFSHTDFHACSCAIVIILLDSILHPSNKAFSKVTIGIKALRFMAVNNANARNGLSHIEIFLEIVNSALMSLFKRQALQRESTVTLPDISSGLESYRNNQGLGLDQGTDLQLPTNMPFTSSQDSDEPLEANFSPGEAGLLFNSIESVRDGYLALYLPSWEG